MLNTLEKFNFFKETNVDNQINDKYTVIPNMIFDTLILKDTDRAQLPLQLLLSTVTTLSHKIQHNPHARTRRESQLCLNS